LINYLPEILLNSELQLVNNSKKLKEDPDLYNDEYINELMELRDEYIKLDLDDSPGLQEIKRKKRDKIRILSSKTYIHRSGNEFGEMILLLVNKLATSNRFNGYNYINEMKSLAIEHILKYSSNFDPFKTSKISNQYVSAFTYLTTFAFNAFVATINKHKQNEEKAKDDFLETQKLFHRDPNKSTYGKDHSEVEKIVVFQKIDSSLLNEVSKITLDSKDILVKYPKDYRINISEYEQLCQYADENRVNISYVRLS